MFTTPTTVMKLALLLSWLIPALCTPLAVHARPLGTREVVSPPILNPNASTIWTIGDTVPVVWDMSDFPPSVYSGVNLGMIVLGYYNTSGDEVRDMANPILKGFNITTGSVDITVPNVTPGASWFIVLLGDSGNKSPEFTIQAPAAGASGSSFWPSATNLAGPSARLTTTVPAPAVTTPSYSTLPTGSTAPSQSAKSAARRAATGRALVASAVGVLLISAVIS